MLESSNAYMDQFLGIWVVVIKEPEVALDGFSHRDPFVLKQSLTCFTRIS